MIDIYGASCKQSQADEAKPLALCTNESLLLLITEKFNKTGCSDISIDLQIRMSKFANFNDLEV